MLPKVADIVIIGSGIMGLSTAYHLAQRGCRNILILERELQPGGWTTTRCGGGLRSQFSHELLIRITQLSMRCLKELELESGSNLMFTKNGYLFLLTALDDLPVFQSAVKLQHNLGIATEWLTPEEIHRYLPVLHIPDVIAGTFHAHDGWIDPLKVTQCYLTMLRRSGVLLALGETVVAIETKGGRIQSVVTPSGRIATPVVVNAAGPWAGSIANMVNIQLPIKPVLHLGFTSVPLKALADSFPTLIFPSLNFGLRSQTAMLMAGTTNWAAKPDCVLEQGNSEIERDLYQTVQHRLPSLGAITIARHWAGWYEMTPDALPVIGWMPQVAGFYCLAGFCGHGFMHGPACGLLTAEEILNSGVHTLDITSLHADRFLRRSINGGEDSSHMSVASY